MTVTEAWNLVGGLSTPSKMPCHGWSISSKHCKMGGRMKDISGSICSKCYASKGRYSFENVQKALENRLTALDNPKWVEAMAFLINKKEKSGYFRWFDSGDLQSIEHLRKIVEVCRLTPNIKHWLPTREIFILGSFLLNDIFPENLTVRLSANFIDYPPPISAQFLGIFSVPTSTVRTEGYTCKAPAQGNQCLDCRMCWDKTIANVSYHAH